MASTGSPSPPSGDENRGRLITAVISFCIMAVLSLFIPYATIGVGIMLAVIGGFALIWERVILMRRVWWFYFIGGLLLASYGVYLSLSYLKQLSLT